MSYCVHYYKDAMLNRFYAICNCCSCCCDAMNAHRNGTPMIASSGYVARVDEDLCAGCGECAGACQFAAISVNDRVAVIDAAACMGCGVCVALPTGVHFPAARRSQGRAVGDPDTHLIIWGPVRFWLYTITTCRGFEPDLGKPALVSLPMSQHPPLEAVLTTFINDLTDLAPRKDVSKDVSTPISRHMDRKGILC